MARFARSGDVWEGDAGNGGTSAAPLETEPGEHVVVSIENCRDLGGYPTPNGPTQPWRFLRSGNTAAVNPVDRAFLLDQGLARDMDLRSVDETRSYPDAFERVRGVRYQNVPLHNSNLHDPRFATQSTGNDTNDFLTNGYLKMLGNHKAVRKIFRFFSHAKDDECVLFHCAAGMDRTGVTAMLLLGLAGVDRDHIVADYGYSFGPPAAVDALVFGWVGKHAAHMAKDVRAADDPEFTEGSHEALGSLLPIMANVYDGVIDAYGSVEAYLLACGCRTRELDRVRAHLLD